MKLVLQIAAGIILVYCVLMLLGSLRHWRLRREERRSVRRVMSELALGLAAVVIVILLVSRQL
jgi:succinate dehydrogenase hydrophobic anchor subunit